MQSPHSHQFDSFRTGRDEIVPDLSISRLNSGYQVHRLESLDAIAPHENAWRELECRDRSAYTIFQTFDWCVTWLQFQEKSPSTLAVTPCIILVYRDDQLQLVCPLMLQRSVGTNNLLSFVGEPHTQYGNVLIAPDRDSTELLEACWNEIRRSKTADSVRWNCVPATSALAAFLGENAQPLDIPNETSLMEFDGVTDWEAYQATLSSSMRRGRAKRRNKLARTGDLTFVALWPGNTGFDEAISDVIRFKCDWLRETGRVGAGVAHDQLEAFLGSLPGSREPLEGLIVHAVRLNGRNIAIEAGLVRHGDYSCFLGGFDWALNAWSPGKVQIEYSFRWFLENGIRRYDFLPNPAEYKSGWTNAREDVVSFVCPLTLKGRAVELATGQIMRKRIKRIFYSLPLPLRSFAIAITRSQK